MSRDLSDKQKWLLALAYSYAERHGGDPTPITNLSEVFFDYDRDDYYLSSVKRSQHFQSRRAVQELCPARPDGGGRDRDQPDRRHPVLIRALLPEGLAAARAGTALNFPVRPLREPAQ